jgi:hypothetical protein
MFRITMMAACAAITLSSAIAHAQSGAPPSLADVARQTAARWATGKKATKVYTNASLATAAEDPLSAGTVSVATAAPPTTASAPASQAPAAAAAAPTGNEQGTKAVPAEDENAWRQEAASKRRDLDQAKAALDALQRSAAPAERQVQQAQREVAYFERRLNTFLKAAEAAKIPPGWVQLR